MQNTLITLFIVAAIVLVEWDMICSISVRVSDDDETF